MDHCGIDLGGKESQICLRDEQGTIRWEGRWGTASLPTFFKEMRPARVIIETTAEAFRVADAAKEAGHEVRVVPATLVKTLGVGARKTKTDRRDARVLSEVSTRIDLPSVHIPSAASRQRKTMAGVHDVLTGSRTKMVNNVRGWMRGQGLKPGRGGVETFTRRVRALGELPECISDELELIDVLSLKITASEKRFEKATKEDAVCRRLMTVPGVGPSTALRFVAAIDDIGRFPSAHKVEAYLGLAPGESSSSEKQQRLSITKAGPSTVRWVLIQAAWVLKTRCRGPEVRALQHWATEVEKRRGPRVAVVALARRLAGILFALWRDGTTFEPR